MHTALHPRISMKEADKIKTIVVQGVIVVLAALCLFWTVNHASAQVSLEEKGNSQLRTSDISPFKMAMEGSEGFFDDIRDAGWKRLMERIQTTPSCAASCAAEPAAHWYQNNWEPNFTCLDERRIGRWGDGGKWVCDPRRIVAKAEAGHGCLVYSVGSNNDFSFEESILRDISPACEIHTFDPTIGDRPAKPLADEQITFHPWGLSNKNDGKYKTLQTIMQDLDHGNREIDILKIDCEGCEWSSYESWLDKGIRIRQILIELHQGTEGATPLPAMKFMESLSQRGFVIFHKEPNIQWAGGACIEYAFVRLASPEARHAGIVNNTRSRT